MNLHPSYALVVGLLVAACSPDAATATNATTPRASASPPASQSPSPSPSAPSSPAAEVSPDPAACGSAGQELTVRQAGACYLAIIDPVNQTLPPLVRVVLVDAPD